MGRILLFAAAYIRRTVSLTLMACACLPAGAALPAEGPDNASGGEATVPAVTAEAAIVVDALEGRVLWSHNPDQRMYPASLTKMTTCAIALEQNADTSRMVTIAPEVAAVPETGLALTTGERLPLLTLIQAALIYSANDAAAGVAQGTAGSVAAFVELMNRRVAEWGAKNTHFANPHGLHAEQHWSTARDLAIIAREAMQNPEFREIARLTSFTLPETNMSKARRFNNRANDFLTAGEDNKYYYPYATGMKTGNHSQAGDCFVGSATKAGIPLISVVLNSGSTDKWRDTIRLMDYGFSQFVSTSVAELYKKNPKVINIGGFALEDIDLGRLQLNIRKMDPAANDNLVSLKSSTEDPTTNYASRTQIEYTRTLEAPIQAGEVMGIMTYTPPSPGAEPVQYELLAARSIERRPSLAPTLDEIRAYTAADPNPFPRFSLEFLIIVLLPVLAVAVVSHFLFKLMTRRRKPKLKQKLEYKTRYYR